MSLLGIIRTSILILIISNVEGIGNVSESYSFDIDPEPAPLAALSLKKASTSNVERAIVLSRQQNDEIVKRHNDLRTIVAPSATKMRKFTWDQELANIATKYSRQCIYEHNKARKHSRFSYIGENLFISIGIPWSTNLVTDAVSAWDAEKEDYDYATRKCKPGRKCGHYTQTAWDDTFKVGCGVTICRRVTVNGKTWRSATLFACNYGPGGNYDRHPFVSGPSCSNCDAGDVCEDNLCTNTIRDIDFDKVKGQWSQWSQWSPCSSTCIGGFASRERTCSTFVTSDCKGFGNERTYGCATDFCNPNIPGSPGNGDTQYHPWGAWSQCSASCGEGKKTRSRRCKSGSCSGFSIMSFTCNEGSCPAVTRPPAPRGTWSRWGQWGQCSVTCGAGMRKRRRSCRGGSDCPGLAVLRGKCNSRLCVGKWSKWSSWSSCSETCGSGSRVRGRRCTTGSNCIGAFEAVEICNMATCPGIFSVWSSWAQCSRSCGPGTTSRVRTCTTSDPCRGRRKDQKPCNAGSCPEFNKWTTWSSCDVTCGSGSRSRTRSCSSGKSADCAGQSSQNKACNRQECLNPGWNFWSTWSSCNATCGVGWRARNRTCHGGNPRSRVCPRNTGDTERCQMRRCPELSQWSDWSRCSATCGMGIKSRRRYCQFGGGCVGDRTQEKTCTATKCIQSTWDSWEKWSSCSEDCGEGIHTRTRLCLVGIERIPCVGDSDESRVCNIKSCEGTSNGTNTGGNGAGLIAASKFLILTVTIPFLYTGYV